MSLAEAVIAGERLALARLLTQVENDTSEGQAAMDTLFPHTGRAHLIGITGSPGTGKSSLVNQLARRYRHPPLDEETPRRVAIVAVDPTSPFSGGAVLGDRVRMRDLAGDPGVFIRSMASRGAVGGLARSTAAVVQVLDAAGYELILVETVGAGQSEIDIARLAHTTIVVEAPGLGDDIQAIKAGILEIADILVVNKADRPGVENTERSLKTMLEMGNPLEAESGWKPPVIRTVASSGEGIEDLASAVARHKQHLLEHGRWQQRDRERLANELELRLREELFTRWRSGISEEHYQAVIAKLAGRELSPYRAVAKLIE